MSDPQTRILVTGASGQLGRLVVEQLLDLIGPERIVAAARQLASIEALVARGVEARVVDYEAPQTLDAALAGIDRVLLISTNAMGARVRQHRNVIEAAGRAGVRFLAYTSVLHADVSPLGLAADHRDTEALLRQSGTPYAILRNGWYTENYTGSLAAALAHHVILGSSGEGRIASATRADYAAAAAAVMTGPAESGRIYELAGDEAYTMAELAAEAARQSGQAVAYVDMPQADYAAALRAAGLPGPVADLISDSAAAAAKGALFDDSHTLSALIGRPTTPMPVSVKAALAAM